MHISQVKQEFRSIGITAHRGNGKYLVVGVVYRGKDIIDGVISRVSCLELVEAISDMLRGSKHYGQVRLILLDEELLPEQISAENLWKLTGKPVLLFTKNDEIDPRYFFKYKERVLRAAGIDEDSARRVLDRIMRKSGSETLKISNMIMEILVALHNV